MINKEHALKIKRKLKAKDLKAKKNRPHDLYGVYYNDVLILSMSIRRGSAKELGHGHLPEQLFVQPGECLRLAQCTISREKWIKLMKERGVIENDTPPSQ
jgi:hypothetical protein